MSDAAKRGRRNRQRGQEGEREVCALAHEHFGIDVSRNLGQERDSGPDVDLPPFSIECKRRKAFAGLYEWLDQAMGKGVEASSFVVYPVVALRADRKEWLVVMRFDDWALLAREEVAASKNA